MHPAFLPPRPNQNFGVAMAENLHSENTGAGVCLEQIPAFIEDMRRGLTRVEEALRYRVQHMSLPSNKEENCPVLSRFERVRVGQILADVVLDIVAISVAGGGDTHDALLNTCEMLCCMKSRAEVTSLSSCGLRDFTHFVPHETSREGVVRSSDFLPRETADEYTLEPSFSKSVALSLTSNSRERTLEGVSGDVEGRAEDATAEPHTQSHQKQYGGGGSDGSSDLSVTPFERPNTFPSGFQGSTRNVSPTVERLRSVVRPAQRHNTISSLESHGNSSNSKRTRLHESSHDVAACQHPLSYSESPLSPTSVLFKPVLSMYSMADSSTVCLPPSRWPRKYYDIDFQKLSDFTHCLRVVEKLFFTDSDFEKIGLRYAIPGIRELDPNEVRSRKDCMDERCNSKANRFNRPEDDEVTKATNSMTITGCGADVEPKSSRFVLKEGNFSSSSFPPPLPGATTDVQLVDNEVASATQSSLSRSPLSHPLTGRMSPSSDVRASATSSPSCKDQCLPLFRGGKDIIVQKKDLQIFIAMVEARLKQVDQEVDGRLHIAGVDLASSSGEDDTLYIS